MKNLETTTAVQSTNAIKIEFGKAYLADLKLDNYGRMTATIKQDTMKRYPSGAAPAVGLLGISSAKTKDFKSTRVAFVKLPEVIKVDGRDVEADSDEGMTYLRGQIEANVSSMHLQYVYGHDAVSVMSTGQKYQYDKFLAEGDEAAAQKIADNLALRDKDGNQIADAEGALVYRNTLAQGSAVADEKNGVVFASGSSSTAEENPFVDGNNSVA